MPVLSSTGPVRGLGPAFRRWYQRRTDVLAALGLFVLGVLIYLAGLRSLAGDEDVSLAARILVLGVGSAGLLLRRRRPVLALGIVLVALVVDVWWGVTLSMLAVLVDALYAATLYGSRRVSRIMVGVVAVTAFSAAVTGLVLGRDWRLAFLLTLQAGLIPLVPVWWAMNLRQHREAAEAERIRTEQVARIAELDRRSAVAAERARLARDLHDIIAGHLSAIALQSEAVLSMADGDRATIRTVLRSVRENSVQSLAEMRAMIDLLRSEGGIDRPEEIDRPKETDRPRERADPTTAAAGLDGLGPLLESARAAGLRVEATSEITGLPVAADLAAYRIVQEALTNAIKHAPGCRAWVSAALDGDRLVVEVTNELPSKVTDEASGEVTRGLTRASPTLGAVANERAGTGLASMRERAEAVGGSLCVGRSGQSWRVRAVLPVGELPAGRTPVERPPVAGPPVGRVET